MAFGFSHGRFCALLTGMISVLAVSHAHAELFPTIKDPFLTQKKVAPYGTGLKPAHCPPPPDTTKPLALNEVVISVVCNNPDARAAYLSLLASADSYDGTIVSYLPDLTANATGSRVATKSDGIKVITPSSSIQASAGMVLYDFGRREANLDIAERTLAAAGLSYDTTLQGFIASGLQNYFQLLTFQNAVDVTKENLRLTAATLDAAETRYDIGLVPLSDALQARTQHAQAALDVQRAENELAVNRAALAQLMGLPPLTQVSVSELDDSAMMIAPFKDHLPMLIERAKVSRKDLKNRQLQLENAEDSLANTRRRALPTISGNATAGYADWDLLNNDNHRTDSIGVTVSIPIFTGFGQIFSERAQRKQLDAQRLQLTQAERDVEQDVLRSWQNYETSRKTFDISASSLGVARQLQDVALGRYKEGLGSILDAQSAQLAYRNALQNYLTSRYNLLTTRIDLVRAVGELDLNNAMPEGGIPPLLDVVTYVDPVQRSEP